MNKMNAGLIVIFIGIGQIIYSLPFQDYFILSFGVIDIIIGYVLFQIVANTPFKAFMDARKKRVPLMEIERKDGNTEFVVPEYNSGVATTEKYGVFFVNDEDVKTELVSRVKLVHALEGIGKTISRWQVAVIHAVKEIYGVKDYHQVIALANLWHECTNPDCTGHVRNDKKEIIEPFEGVFKHERMVTKNKKTGEVIKRRIKISCPKCEQETGKRVEPPLAIPPMVNIESGSIDHYFKENQNPLFNEANAQDMIMNRLEKEKKDSMMTFVKLTGVALVVISFFIGLYILLQNPELLANIGGTAASTVTGGGSAG